LEYIKDLIKGKEVLGEQSIGAFFDAEKAKKVYSFLRRIRIISSLAMQHYDISKEELAVSSLENAIISRIALRGI
jgi:hypothetical protein